MELIKYCPTCGYSGLKGQQRGECCEGIEENKYCTGCGSELGELKKAIEERPSILACCPDSNFIELREIKGVNPRNREEYFFIDLKDGKIYDRNINEVGRASINKRKKIVTIKTVYVEKLNFSNVKKDFFKV